MIANIIIITAGEDPALVSETLTLCVADRLTLGYRPDMSNPAKNAAVLSALLRADQGNYCIILPPGCCAGGSPHPYLLSLLYAFLLGIHYFSVDTHPVIGVPTGDRGSGDYGNANDIPGDCLKIISDELTKLGLNKPRFVHLPAIDGSIPENNGLLRFDTGQPGGVEPAAVHSRYSHFLDDLRLADGFVFIDDSHPSLTVKCIREFLSAETDFQKNNPVLATLQSEYRSLKKELSQAQNTIVAIQEVSLSYKKYLDFLKERIYSPDSPVTDLNEMEKIKRFYHFEYEILPLWFKRLGHIVKVLMGRRSFKSLFNDHVKKYKE